MDGSQIDQQDGEHERNSESNNPSLQCCESSSEVQNENHSVARQRTMQEASDGISAKETLLNMSDDLAPETQSGTSATENANLAQTSTNTKVCSDAPESCNTGRISSNCESSCESMPTSFSNELINLVTPRTQNDGNSSVMDEVKDFDPGIGVNADPSLHICSAASPRMSSGQQSQLICSSNKRSKRETPEDVESMAFSPVKCFNNSLEDRQLSENDTTWNSHCHIDADGISMETNIGEEIPEDLHAEEDVEDEPTVIQVLKIVDGGQGKSIEEYEIPSDSEITSEKSCNEEEASDPSELLITPALQSSDGSITESSSRLNKSEANLRCDSALQTNLAINDIIEDDSFEVKNPIAVQSALLDEVNERSIESLDNIDEKYSSNESINTETIQERLQSSLTELSNLIPDVNPRVEELVVIPDQNEGNPTSNCLSSSSSPEQNSTAKMNKPTGLNDTTEIEVTTQISNLRRSSTNSQDASVSRISVQSLDLANEELSLDSQTENHLSENRNEERTQSNADQSTRRPPSSRAGRLHIKSSRAVLLDPIIEPGTANAIPSSSSALSPARVTSASRAADSLLLGIPSTGQLYSPSSSPSRSAPPAYYQNDTFDSSEGLATSLDELSMLRLHGTLGESSNRRPMSIIYGHRPVSTRRNSVHRPGSTLNSRPRSTNVCRARSGRHSWPAMKRPASDVHHLPPSGPDCLPGCGYSGLPCYVCSFKRMQEENKLRESSSLRHFGLDFPIWTIFRYGSHRGSRVDPFPMPVVHQPRRGRDRSQNGGPPPSYTSLFPERTCFGIRTCCDKCRHSRLTTMILVVLLVVSVIYVLIVAGHFERRM